VIESESQWYQHPKTGEAHISSGDAVIHLEIEGFVFVSNSPIATELLEIMPAVLKVTDTGVGLNDYACLEIQKYCSGEKIYGVLYSLGEDIAYYKEVGLEEYSPTLPDALALLLIRLTKDGLI
jgi:hypothetical protein